MKKLYSLLAAAFVCVAANAQLYVCGMGTIGDTTLEWTPETPYVVTASADGTYNFTVKGTTQIKMSTTMGEWAAFNEGAVNTPAVAVGENVLEACDANTGFPWEGDWTLKVDLTAMTLTASTTTPQPTGFTKLYLVGSIAGLPESWGDGFIESHELKTTDGVVYTLDNVQFAMKDEFKISGKNWSPNIGAGTVSQVYPGVEVTLVKGSNPGNLTVMVPYTGQVSYNYETDAFIFGSLAGIEGVEIDTVDVAPVYYNLQGVRVDDAQNGLFIEVRGNKAVKVIK